MVSAPRGPTVSARFVVVVLAVVLTAPALPAGTDPCAGTVGVEARGNHVCHDGDLVAALPSAVVGTAAGSFDGLAFAAFTLAAGDRLAAFNDGSGWSSPVPAGTTLRTYVQPSGARPTGNEPYLLLLLETPMTTAWQRALKVIGVTTHAFLPDHGLLVGLASATGDPRTLPFVRDAIPLEPPMKVEPGLDQREGPELVNILTVPAAAGARDATMAALDRLGATVVADQPEIERITAWLDAGHVLELAATPEIMWIGQASLDAETDMDIIRGFTGANAVATAPGNYRGAGVTGMVMDTGLETTHPDFQASLLGVDGTNSPDSHGTSVYGIVFGSAAGNAQALGMAPDAKGVFAWWSSGLSRYQHASNLVNGWGGGVFHTNSWGRGVPKDNTYDAYSNENDRVVFELDVLMLQSMSNCGPQCARREAMAKNILSIGGMYHKNNANPDDDVWNSGALSRASTGPAADGRIKPELVGPYDAIFTTTTGNAYTSGFGGTSGATPVVAGAVALVNEMVKDGLFGAGAGSFPSPAMVKALLVASSHAYRPEQVRPVAASQQAADLWSRNIQGWGLPDLQALHDAAAGSLLQDELVTLETGRVHAVPYTPPPGTREVRITLAWTDVPASPATGSGKTLINDLDLEVTDATGQVVFRGNAGLRDAPLSRPSVSMLDADRLNNVENVFLPATGPISILVRAAAVNLDGEPATPELDQPYALAVLPIR